MTAPAFGSVVSYVHDDPKTILDFYCAAFGLTIRYYNATAQFGELETGATSLAVAAHSAGTLMVGEPYAPYGDGNPKNTEVAFLTADVPAEESACSSSRLHPAVRPQTDALGADGRVCPQHRGHLSWTPYARGIISNESFSHLPQGGIPKNEGFLIRQPSCRCQSSYTNVRLWSSVRPKEKFPTMSFSKDDFITDHRK